MLQVVRYASKDILKDLPAQYCQSDHPDLIMGVLCFHAQPMLDGQTLDEAQSREIAKQISSKAKAPFDNAYRGALAIAESVYIQGFLVIAGKGNSKPIEHAWLEVNDQIVDPSFPALNRKAQDLSYFPAHRLSVKQLKAAIEEAKEDYPEDNPLPIYGAMPYEYYGDVMLGDRTYQTAYQTAQAKCREARGEGMKG